MLDLYSTIASLNDPDDIFRFLQDLCSPAELREFENRWAVAQLLHRGALSYRDIATYVGTSPTTVTRVAKALNDESTQGLKRAMMKDGKVRRKL